MNPHVSGKQAERNRPRPEMKQKPSARHFEIPRLRRLAVAPKQTQFAFATALPSPVLPFRIPSSQVAAARRICSAVAAASTSTTIPAMELFPDGGFVRLESRANGMFVHTDKDWERVTLLPNGAVPSLNAVWRVERWVLEELQVTFVFLQNAAYGRYLSFSNQEAPFGQSGFRATQADRGVPDVKNANLWPCIWNVLRLPPPDQDYVRLRYFNYNLRANGGRLFPCNNGVTAELGPLLFEIPTIMHWKVHAVGASRVPQSLPVTPTHHQGGCLSGLLFWRRDPDSDLYARRTIRFVRATDEGDFDQDSNNWESFGLHYNSLMSLKYRLGTLQEEWNEDLSTYTVCIRPGTHGRLMPLVADPPRSLESMNIVIFRTGSPAAAALVYPAGPEE